MPIPVDNPPRAYTNLFPLSEDESCTCVQILKSQSKRAHKVSIIACVAIEVAPPHECSMNLHDAGVVICNHGEAICNALVDIEISSTNRKFSGQMLPDNAEAKLIDAKRVRITTTIYGREPRQKPSRPGKLYKLFRAALGDDYVLEHKAYVCGVDSAKGLRPARPSFTCTAWIEKTADVAPHLSIVETTSNAKLSSQAVPAGVTRSSTKI